MKSPNYLKTIPTMFAVVAVTSFTKDALVALEILPRGNCALLFFSFGLLLSYIFHTGVRRGFFPWFSDSSDS